MKDYMNLINPRKSKKLQSLIIESLKYRFLRAISIMQLLSGNKGLL